MTKLFSRRLSFIFTAVIMLGLLTGCGNTADSSGASGDESSTTTSGITRTPADIHWAAGSSSGPCYITGTVVGGPLSAMYEGYAVVPEVTTGGLENAKMLLAGDAQFISIQTDDAMAVNSNTRDWVDVPEATDALRYVSCANSTKMNLIVKLKDDSINSFEDLKGKRVGVLAGSTYNFGWAYLLEAFGFTEDDFASVEVMSRPDLCNALQDGSVDFVFDIMQDNQAAHQEVAFAVGGYKILSIPDDIRAKLKELNPAYQEATIAADSYNGNEEAKTMGLYNIWATSKDMDDQVIYDILTVLHDNDENIKAASPAAGVASDEEILANQLIPWHPAAERFYKERGIIK